MPTQQVNELATTRNSRNILVDVFQVTLDSMHKDFRKKESGKEKFQKEERSKQRKI
jgi:hypothetical protein